MNSTFDSFRMIHIILALLFIYILTPVIPLTVRNKRRHRVFAWMYLGIFSFLVVSGFRMDSVLFVPSWNNVHALVNIFLRNSAIFLFCILGVIPIFSFTRPVFIRMQKYIFFTTATITAASGLVILIYGLFSSFINVTTNRSAPLLPMAHIYPSHVLFGIFIFIIAFNRIRSFSSKADKIKIHRRHMSAALLLSLLNAMTVEVNKHDIFHSDLLYLALVVLAVIVYVADAFKWRRLDERKPDKVLSGVLAFFIVLASVNVFILKYQPSQDYFYGVKIITTNEDAEEKNSPPLMNIPGCTYLPKLYKAETGKKLLIRIIQCENSLSLRKVMNDIVVKKGDDSSHTQINSVTGIGAKSIEPIDLAKRDHLFPVVLVNFAHNNSNLTNSFTSRMKPLGCHPLIEFKVINYFEMLAGSDYIKIYQCPDVSPHTMAFGNLIRFTNGIDGPDAKALLIVSKPGMPKN